jgi:GNAT superfamily N-acetyltransferase
MPAPNITIDYLANHRELAPELGKLFYDEWRSIYDHRGQSFKDVVSTCLGRANIGSLPLALIAFHDEELVGTVSLKVQDLEIQPELTPWLGGLFVIPRWRGMGVASSLIQRAIEEAQRLKLKQLYLWTPSAESLYRKFGWSEVERTDYCGQQIVIMRRPGPDPSRCEVRVVAACH